jgi:hypothetical protein
MFWDFWNKPWTLNSTESLALAAVMVGPLAMVFFWELTNKRIAWPFGVERAKQPGWYRLHIAIQSLLLVALTLLGGMFFLAGIVTDISN